MAPGTGRTVFQLQRHSGIRQRRDVKLSSPCRRPSSGICRTVSRRSPALPGRRRSTWPAARTSRPARTESTIQGTCAGAAAFQAPVFPSHGPRNFIYRSPELRGQSLLVAKRWEAGRSAPSPLGSRARRSASRSAAAQSAYGEPGYGGGCLQFCAGDRADRVPGVPLKVRQGGRVAVGKAVLQSGCVCHSPRRHLWQQRAATSFTARRASTSTAALMKNLSDPGTVPVAVPLRVLQRFQPPDHEHSGYNTVPTRPLARSTAGRGSDAAHSACGPGALKFTF